MSKSPKKSKSLTRAGNRPATISAQQTIPYVRMLPDGICQLPGGVYTKTLEYEDINYSVASAEDQTAIFGGWSSWLNYFDSSLPFQLSLVNRRSRFGSRYKVNISEADDRFNSVRTEYTGMLKNQIAKSNNGIERAKYVTFCIPAENVAAARPRLERVEADVIGNFKRLGVQSQPLDGRERLALLHGQLHPGSREPFRFKWTDIAHTGMGTKDFIVPDSFDFRQSRSFRVGQTWGAASYLQIMASELSDKLLLEILELDAELTVTMHIQTVDQVKATNKQFITVQTSGGNTFYIVIDYDKPTDEDGEQYHTYFLNMVDEADLLAAMQAAGGELPECSCADKCAVGAINTDCTVCAVNMSECQGKAPEPAPVVEPEPDPEPEQPKATGNGGILLLALAVVVIGGGAGWYFKIYRPKKQRAAESEADYGGEYDGAEDYDETAPEDDGPPWDEDGEE